MSPNAIKLASAITASFLAVASAAPLARRTAIVEQAMSPADTGTPVTRATTDGKNHIVEPTLMPGTEMDQGAIIGILGGLVFVLLSCLALGFCMFKASKRAALAARRKKSKGKAKKGSSKHRVRHAAGPSKAAKARRNRTGSAPKKGRSQVHDAETDAASRRAARSCGSSPRSRGGDFGAKEDMSGLSSAMLGCDLPEQSGMAEQQQQRGRGSATPEVPVARSGRSNSVSSMGDSDDEVDRGRSTRRRESVSTLHSDTSHR